MFNQNLFVIFITSKSYDRINNLQLHFQLKQEKALSKCTFRQQEIVTELLYSSSLLKIMLPPTACRITKYTHRFINV